MKLLYYVEMKDSKNPDEWENKVDIYGYTDSVLVMAMGYSRKYSTANIEATVKVIDKVVEKLEIADFVVINRDDKRELLVAN